MCYPCIRFKTIWAFLSAYETLFYCRIIEFKHVIYLREIYVCLKIRSWDEKNVAMFFFSGPFLDGSRCKGGRQVHIRLKSRNIFNIHSKNRRMSVDQEHWKVMLKGITAPSFSWSHTCVEDIFLVYQSMYRCHLNDVTESRNCIGCTPLSWCS